MNVRTVTHHVVLFFMIVQRKLRMLSEKQWRENIRVIEEISKEPNVFIYDDFGDFAKGLKVFAEDKEIG